MAPGTIKNHIVFVYPPANEAPLESIRAHFKMCLGSAYLITYLRQQGFTAQQFVTEEPLNAAACVARLAALKPGAVGFTVDNSNYFLCRIMAEALKAIAPGIIIVLGGILPTMYSEDILAGHPFFDICARNESEETCAELLTRLDDVDFQLKKASLEKVKGITYKQDGEVFKNPERDVFMSNRDTPDFLDKYPSPYLSGVIDSYKLGIVSARGCNQFCAYCICPVMSKRIITTHSVSRVVEEFDYISKHLLPENGVVDVFDDTFTLIPARTMEICRKMIENKIKINFACITRCDRVDEELIDTMKEAGCNHLGLSLESAVPRILRIIGKIQDPQTKDDDHFEKERAFIEKFKKYIRYAKKIGIPNVYTSIMLGVPSETAAEGRQTVELIDSLDKNLDFYGHNIFRAYPGTPIFRECPKHGIKLTKTVNHFQYKTHHTYDTSALPVAPDSHLEIGAIDRDKDILKTMAFLPQKNRKPCKTFFHKLILYAPIITKELVVWIKENMVINGTLIHIYPDLESIEENRLANDDTRAIHLSPTSYYAVFFHSTREDGVKTLVPYRFYSTVKRVGITINLPDTQWGISANQEELDPLQSVCIDRKREDVLELHALLSEKEKKNTGNPFDVPIYPYFNGLCRWEKKQANCFNPETLIADAENNLKTCWNGEPVGKVGMPFPEILANIKKIRREVESKRGCKSCDSQDRCNACIFPSPLPADEYCNLVRTSDTTDGTSKIRTIDLFKELE
ncbi:MAG: radical SAM protein [bacterium]|nr:radical SAM protein [bacterium]